ncbi:unnamed protein product [Gongylonema pulchrum]|uniref:Secreted protein n=1 Tax=Gongylonema pulchrum TaxID=637853 RepID=A0A183EZ03_9BILA|nr:unnamed protein product [Gongylonema pulchrum]
MLLLLLLSVISIVPPVSMLLAAVGCSSGDTSLAVSSMFGVVSDRSFHACAGLASIFSLFRNHYMYNCLKEFELS